MRAVELSTVSMALPHFPGFGILETAEERLDCTGYPEDTTVLWVGIGAEVRSRYNELKLARDRE